MNTSLKKVAQSRSGDTQHHSVTDDDNKARFSCSRCYWRDITFVAVVTMVSDPSSQSITASAREKLQSVWTSLRSINTEDMESRVASLAKWTPLYGDEENPLESILRTMFGSCTNAADDMTTSETSPRRTSSSNEQSAKTNNDDHSRAKSAVHSVREKAEQRETSPTKRKRSIPKPFPMSSPPQQKTNINTYVLQKKTPPIPDLASGVDTFDDGISAISAHTLEELERQNQLKNSHTLVTVKSDLTQNEGLVERIIPTISKESSSTLFPGLAEEEEEERECIGALTSPYRLNRNSWGSKGSGRNRSFQTASTQSTDFEKMFTENEAEYWKDTVQQDEICVSPIVVSKKTVRQLHTLIKERYRSRSGDSDLLTLKQDTTMTTAGTSFYSSSTSPFRSRHPHETMPLAPSDFLRPHILRDPDRIQDMIAVHPDAEIGEI